MRRGFAGRGPSASDAHRSWLALVDLDGPFLSVPVLKDAWPQGMPQLSLPAKSALMDAKPDFEKAWEAWDRRRDDDQALTTYRTARDAWVDVVLRQVLGWRDTYTTDLSAAALAEADRGVRAPNHSVTVTPSGALCHRDLVGALTLVVDPVDSLRDALADGWAASPIDRMEELLRASGVAIGVVTDGRWWAIVSARRETMVASGIVDAQTWVEEPETRNAFVELLSVSRLVGGKPEHRLTELFGRSVAAAEEVTEALGVQVRRAVELLTQSLSESALEARENGFGEVLPEDREQVYEAAVTMMMRVVFLLFAEERGLLPQGRLFSMGYGISGEMDVLDQRARDEGPEALDATFMTWHRLLATSQALYHGASFEDLRLPSYGGSLFDPDRFAFLLRRTDRGALAVTVSDRVMLEVLRAVQMAQLRKGEPARRISFRDIDVEQIGYIYEGLLGYSCADVDEETVGLIGKPGAEPEMTLTELEEIRARYRADAMFADAVIASVKKSQPGSQPTTKAAFAKALSQVPEDVELALRSVTSDDMMRERLRPFVGIIRRDLRDRPVVMPPGGLIIVETPSRATAGAHYTPRSLAEEVVLHALEPLVFSPGPHDTGDRDTWKPVSSDTILDLKVADIACGSGAFLVAAARYLSDRLVEAWQREGVAHGTPHELRTHAIRQVVANCLYGADINGMAVEMCKLSLWLVSLDPRLPFSFVDDKILHGNSLLGLTDVRQLKALHIDPEKKGTSRLFDDVLGGDVVRELDVEGVLDKAASLRRRLSSEVDNDDPQRSATTKRRQWREYQELTRQLTDIADGVIAAGLRLGGKPGKGLDEAYENLRIAVARAYHPDESKRNRSMLDGILDAGLTPTVETDYDRWKPLHWILAVPDVMTKGGFSAVIGNPPFLGGKKQSAAFGTNLREWLANLIARMSGNADLIAYFLLRATELLTSSGCLGLIATSTVAQGDTREVGLDQMGGKGFTIVRAIQSRTWPASSANLEYAAVWGVMRLVSDSVIRVCDGRRVTRISTLLEPAGRVHGRPHQLLESRGMAFQGCIVLGMGFIVDQEQARGWINADPAVQEVVVPYLNGDDLNSRAGAAPSRWVIDFGERTQVEAEAYLAPWKHVLQYVRPERIAKDGMKYPRMVNEWWKFWNARPALRAAISNKREVLAMTRHSISVMPLRVPTGCVFSDALVVFATDDFAQQAILSSTPHQLWAIANGSSLGHNTTRYTPTDVFGTFCRPPSLEGLSRVGKRLDAERHEIMLGRDLGLTKLYNLVNDPGIASGVDPDVDRMREIHVELDEAVMAAYGWEEVPLEHGFHTYRQMTRWTVSPAARVEILDRLLEENHRRAALQGDAVPKQDADADADVEGDDE